MCVCSEGGCEQSHALNKINTVHAMTYMMNSSMRVFLCQLYSCTMTCCTNGGNWQQ